MRYTNGYVLCPIEGRIEIRRCYDCPFYEFRNYNYVVCKKEFSRKFGENYDIVKKNPLVVRDEAGNMWVWTNGEGKPSGWYRYTEGGKVDFSTSLD